jgi:mono/diheme cytochrome c family protein
VEMSQADRREFRGVPGSRAIAPANNFLKIKVNGMTRKWMIGIVFGWLVNSVAANAQPNISRAELLYSTHCISCHNDEIHWRDKLLATDWLSLKVQVRRWQGTTGLVWREDDITQVAHYLNATYYHYPE